MTQKLGQDSSQWLRCVILSLLCFVCMKFVLVYVCCKVYDYADCPKTFLRPSKEISIYVEFIYLYRDLNCLRLHCM